MRKLPEDVRAEEGRALARLGDGGWDPLVQAGRRAGRLRRRARRRPRPRRCAAGARRSPGSRRSPRAAAARSCPTSPRGSPRRSALPFAPVLERTGDGPPQREMANSAQQVANVRGAVRRHGRAAARPVPARRRRALQRLDARDGRRPAAPPRRAGGLSAGADLGVLAPWCTERHRRSLQRALEEQVLRRISSRGSGVASSRSSGSAATCGSSAEAGELRDPPHRHLERPVGAVGELLVGLEVVEQRRLAEQVAGRPTARRPS